MQVDLTKILATIIAGASLAWGTYVSSEVISAKERLARIETKLDQIAESLKKYGR